MVDGHTVDLALPTAGALRATLTLARGGLIRLPGALRRPWVRACLATAPPSSAPDTTLDALRADGIALACAAAVQLCADDLTADDLSTLRERALAALPAAAAQWREAARRLARRLDLPEPPDDGDAAALRERAEQLLAPAVAFTVQEEKYELPFDDVALFWCALARSADADAVPWFRSGHIIVQSWSPDGPRMTRLAHAYTAALLAEVPRPHGFRDWQDRVWSPLQHLIAATEAAARPRAVAEEAPTPLRLPPAARAALGGWADDPAVHAALRAASTWWPAAADADTVPASTWRPAAAALARGVPPDELAGALAPLGHALADARRELEAGRLGVALPPEALGAVALWLRDGMDHPDDVADLEDVLRVATAGHALAAETFTALNAALEHALGAGEARKPWRAARRAWTLRGRRGGWRVAGEAVSADHFAAAVADAAPVLRADVALAGREAAWRARAADLAHRLDLLAAARARGVIAPGDDAPWFVVAHPGSTHAALFGRARNADADATERLDGRGAWVAGPRLTPWLRARLDPDGAIEVLAGEAVDAATAPLPRPLGPGAPVWRDDGTEGVLSEVRIEAHVEEPAHGSAGHLAHWPTGLGPAAIPTAWPVEPGGAALQTLVEELGSPWPRRGDGPPADRARGHAGARARAWLERLAIALRPRLAALPASSGLDARVEGPRAAVEDQVAIAAAALEAVGLPARRGGLHGSPALVTALADGGWWALEPGSAPRWVCVHRPTGDPDHLGSWRSLVGLARRG